MPDLAVRALLLLACLAPLVAGLGVGVADLLGASRRERVVAPVVAVAVGLAVLADLGLAAQLLLVPGLQDLDFGAWLQVGTYVVPVVLRLDAVGGAFALMGALLTLIVARFSRTYLHREPGFLRFHVLLAIFAAGTQLVAWAGALDVMFAGWELMGWTSALFIGFFHERAEPTRSAVRAFATYRLCDAGFLLAIVTTHELTGSTRLDHLAGAGVDPRATTVVAALFLVAALGKSAQLPFSSWLPRAMEGPTPSSALFYGGVSLHAGLFLVLRTWTTVDASPAVRGAAVAIGLVTAVYAASVARVHADAKGSLVHATLAQVGLILAEIALGWTVLARWHIVGHVLLRAWQFLRAPNTLHDAHRLGHAGHDEVAPSGRFAVRLHAAALHRLRLDEVLDAMAAPVLRLARALDRVDRAYRRALGDEEPPAKNTS